MKHVKYTLPFFALAILFARGASAEDEKSPTSNFRRITLATKNYTSTVEDRDDQTGQLNGFSYTTTGTAAEIYIGPTLIAPIVKVPQDRRQAFEAGVDFGACYMLHYSPSFWSAKEDDPFLSVGPCFKMGLKIGKDENQNEPEGVDSFLISPMLGVGVLNYLFAGIGYDYRLSLSAGGQDNGSLTYAFGLMLPL